MTHLFSAEEVSVTFGGLKALDGLCLHIDEGTITGLIGPNGSGKTTFFNAVTGLCSVAGGRILLDGKAITGLPPRHVYRCGITRTFQRSRLCLSMSVFDNVIDVVNADRAGGHAGVAGGACPKNVLINQVA